MDLVGRRPFVSWLIIKALVATAAFWLWQNGIAHDVYVNDKFYVVLTILGWFSIASISVAYVCLDIEKNSSEIRMGLSQRLLTVSRRRLTFGWFSSSQLLNLGLAGTTYGFIAMLAAAFVGKDFSNASILATLIPVVGENWAAALYATASGITGTIILSLETYIADYAIDMREQD